MAVSYKDIIITPYRSDATYDPKIEFRGANSASNTAITAYIYPTSNGMLSFEGSVGQLFSVTNDMTGSIYSVNDASGIPSIDVNADGTVSLAPYTGNVAIGSFSSSYKLGVTGTFNATGAITQAGSQVLTAANYTSYAPTTTGGYASGTWSISVNGNAATVSGLTLTNSASGINPDNVTQNQIGYNNSVSLFGQTDGGLYSSAHSSSWIHQIYGDFRTGQIAIRGKNNGTWQSWYYVPSYGYNNTSYSGALYPTIVYDTNNTAYYVDPVGTARLNTIYGGDVYLDNGGWFRNYNSTGIYNQTHGNHFYADGQYWNVGYGGTTAIRLRVTGHAGTVAGYFYGDTSLNSGLLNQSAAWKVRVNGADTEIYDYCYTNDLRTYIMYDRNDTGYYSDPNSTSRLNFINTNNHYIQPGYMLYSDHGSWQGEYNKIQWHANHLYLQNAGGGYLLILRRGDGGERFYCDYNGNVTVSGSVTVNSDRSLKENIKTIENALDFVKRLRGVTFDWIETKKPAYGFIAQEVEEVIPEIVLEYENGTVEGDNKRILKSVDYDKITAVLVEAMKEQQKQIEDLRNEINRLKEGK